MTPITGAVGNRTPRPAAQRAKIPQMDNTKARSLYELVRSLPAAAPLLERLDDEPGIYIVGGAVRDLLLGEEPVDLDLVVEGDSAGLAARLGRSVRVHDRFGTSTVVLGGFSYDVAQARRETYARPGALPDVTPATLAEDLLRRDFTVNALAIALTGPAAGELTAAPGALTDLDARLLRVLHDRSFLDDPTRLLRLARYAARLSFAVEPHTRELADSAVAAGALRTVSGPRVGAELRLLARESDPLAAFATLAGYRLDRAVDPGFGLDDPALAGRALALAPTDVRVDLLVLALACRRLAEGRRAPLLDALAFEAGERDAIIEVASVASRLAAALRVATRPSEIAAAVGGARPETVVLAGALGAQSQAREWLCRLRAIRLEIDGNDLVGAGVAQGPAIGAGLRAALAAKLDGDVADRSAELAEALRAAAAKG